MTGYGILYYSSGKVAYEGYQKKDFFDGKGQIINEYIEKSLIIRLIIRI